MNTAFINNVSDLENSGWMKNAQDSAVLETLEKQVLTWLSKVRVSNQLAKLAQMALLLFIRGRKGELLTPRNCIVLAASLLYMVCPVDAVADVIPVIGLIDDLGVLILALDSIGKVVNLATSKLEPSSEATSAEGQPHMHAC